MRRACLPLPIFAAALLCASPHAHAQQISGAAEALDGDTLSLTGLPVRLFGIDAVEAGQSCENDAGSWGCGADARETLAELVRGRQVECLTREKDADGILVATCHVGDIDLAQAIAQAGFAVALPGSGYEDAEKLAAQYDFGIWASRFDPPAEWRAAHPAAREEAPSSAEAETRAAPAPRTYRNRFGCAIKGNRSRRGEWIYHLPGRPYYDETRPEELFCTEEDAIRAGYRRSKA